MDIDCSPAKRRKILTEHLVNNSESNKDSNPISSNENINTSLACVDEPHSTFCSSETPNAEAVEMTEILGIEQENENNNKAAIEGSKSTTHEMCEIYTAEGEASNGSHPVDEIMNTESKMDEDCSLTKMDATNENGGQISKEDNLAPEILGSSGHNGQLDFRRKLLVLDVNGLLVDIVADPDEAYKPDTKIGSKAVFKRPYCDEFLQFCFERFNVGVWTSRTRRNIERVLDFLIKDSQHQLLFCWDQSHCTETGYKTIENRDKPLVLKELKRLWEKQDPNLPWDKGVYNETNTLLLDDSPYKALRNPPNTAIFPYTYSYHDTQDVGLGPEGDLRKYLERLAASDNVQNFIEENPFGQPPISNINESWKFYLKVIGGTPIERKPRKKLIVFDISGLLVDVITSPREGFRADTWHGSKAVFKRPYCDEFLKFCFEKFNVGIWTATTSYNIERLIDYLMRDTQHKLLFCWDHSYCTDTGFTTVENSCKPLILKELRRLWEKQDPTLPWRRGEYDESNTLLMDYSSNRALLNPPHTAIFPYPYRYWNKDDNSLGPEGDLRIFLERLAASENVQKFVQENPFGQRPITKKNLSWGFYQKVIRSFSSEPEPEADANTSSCKTTSEPKSDTITASLAEKPSEPKSDTITASVGQILSESKSDTVSVSKRSSEPEGDTVSVTEKSSEMEGETVTVPVAEKSSEPEGETVTVSVAEKPAELEGDTVIVSVSEKPADTVPVPVSVAERSSEPEGVTVSVSVSVAQRSSEPEGETVTALVAQKPSEPEANTLAAQILIKNPSLSPLNDDESSGK